MTKNEQLIDRIKAFDDSAELADALDGIAQSCPIRDRYWIKEAEVHILGLYDLAVELGKALEASNDTT